MRESLIAFGFEGDDQATLPDQIAHNTGTDALRVTTLLVHLLAFSPDATLEIDRQPARKWVGKIREARRYIKSKNQSNSWPKPKDFYPFRARVRLNRELALTI
jgi:valyl-tRNA synthetase